MCGRMHIKDCSDIGLKLGGISPMFTTFFLTAISAAPLLVQLIQIHVIQIPASNTLYLDIDGPREERTERTDKFPVFCRTSMLL